MELTEAIHTRRSIRAFTDEPVTDEEITRLISAAMMAPSAGNQRPWQFIITRDKARLHAVTTINPYAGMADKTDLGILVCGDTSLEKYPGFWVQDCSAAIQNLLLAAHDQGLGAVWTGIHPLEERVTGFKDLFNLPDHVIPLAFIPLGHPKKQPPRRTDLKRPKSTGKPGRE